MLSTIIIDGVIKLAQKTINKIGRSRYENRIRIYPMNSVLPEKILFESATKPGVFLDEVEQKMYRITNGKLAAL